MSYTLTPAYYLAVQQGSNKYFTGAPCVNGHISPRRVSDHRCIDCVRAWSNAYLGTDKEKANRRRYDSSLKGRIVQRRYRSTAKRKQSSRRYFLSPKGRATGNRNNKTEKGTAARKRFFQTEKGKACAIREARKRKVRKLGLKCVPYGYRERVVRFTLFDNRCAYCGTCAPLAEDHFIPLKLNGGHFIENIVPACKSCNSRKNASHPEQWYRAQTFFSTERWNLILKYTQLEIVA